MPPEARTTTIGAFREVLAFELGYQLRSPLFGVLAGVFALLAFLGMASEDITIGGGTANLDLNANFAILQSLWVFSVLGVLAVVAFVAGPLLRDAEQRTLEMFLATGVQRAPYLLGRFAAGTGIAIATLTAALLGLLLGTFMPWLDPERIAPFSAGVWLWSFGVLIVPAMVITCSLLFAVTCFWRSVMAGYLMAVGMIVLMAVASANTDAETISVTALIDPFGLIAFGDQVRYWTPAELETRLPALDGVLGLNRALWLVIAALAATAGYLRFRLELATNTGGRDARAARGRGAPEPHVAAVTPRPRVVQDVDGLGIAFAQCLSQLRIETRAILRSAPLWVLLAFGVFNTVSGLLFATSQLYGTPVLPTTSLMVQSILGTFSLMVLLAIVYYAAELMARERGHRIAEIVDATPAAPATRLIAKLLAVWGIVIAMYATAALAAMVVQLAKGFTDIQPGVYAAGLFLEQGWLMLLVGAVAVLVQSLVTRKFVGMFVVILVFLSLNILPNLGIEHPLITLGPTDVLWSDFFGFGHTLAPALLTGAYSTAFAVLLLVAAHLFVQRGTDPSWRARRADARARWTRPAQGVTAVALLAFLGLGAEVWRQSEVLTQFRSSDEITERRAEYERRYAQFRFAPNPQVVDVEVDAAIFPGERRFEVRGHYLLENHEDAPLETLRFSLAPAVEVRRLDLEGAASAEVEADFGWYAFRMDPPLAPGAQRRLEFDLVRSERGIAPNQTFHRLNANGTFVDITDVLPLPGYDSGRELDDPDERREQDLPPVIRAADYDDPVGRMRSAFGNKTRTRFRSTVSTSADQIAVTPGYLVDERVEGDRRIFRYEMDAPIQPFFAWLSADYARRSERIGDVLVEVYFHPQHDWNVEAMIDGTRRAMDYFERNFSPYQYRQFRIFEFPRFARFAQSFPNTIPFSEAIGFTADLSDEDDLDYVLFVTAHELAHQWWGHQVAGADVQGATMLIETLAQYSALMVMKEAWGDAPMRRFLRYELDNYLDARGGERVAEQPLSRVENQAYIHYNKGAVAMYGLADAIGEDAVNRALATFLDRHAFGGPPFPRTGDLIALLRAEAAPEHQQLITDLFERIVLWDLSVDDARVTEVDGGWRVEATLEAHKLEADERGVETEVPLDGSFEVAVFAPGAGELGRYELPEVLHRERVRLTSGTRSWSVVVPERPSRIGLDPFSKFIDRIPADNVRTL